MDIRYSLDENGNKYLPVTHKKAVKGVNLNILDNFSDDKGYIQAIDDADLETMEQFLKSGFYYAKNVINSPESTNSNGYIIIIARSKTYKQAIFIPFNRNRFYLRHQVGKDTGWTGWTLIKSNNSDTSSLFDSDGFIPSIENLDLETMDKVDKTGFYYINNPINSPDETNDNGYLLVFARGNTYKKAMFMPYNKNRVYTRNMMGTDGWGSWMEIGGEVEQEIPKQLNNFSDEEGYIQRLDNVDLDSMDGLPNETGNYYLGDALNTPDGDSIGYLMLLARSSTYQKAVYMPYNKNRIYTRNQLSKGWGEWYQIGNDDLDKKVVGLKDRITELEDRIEKLENMLHSSEELNTSSDNVESNSDDTDINTESNSDNTIS